MGASHWSRDGRISLVEILHVFHVAKDNLLSPVGQTTSRTVAKDFCIISEILLDIAAIKLDIAKGLLETADR